MSKGLIHDIVLKAPGTSGRDPEGRPIVTTIDHPTKGHATVPQITVDTATADASTDTVDIECLIDKRFRVTRAWVVTVGYPRSTGNPNLDGSYRVVNYRPNRWHTVLRLARYEV
jgi:hypothetical protein